MTSITRTCQAPSPSNEALKILAQIAGIQVDFHDLSSSNNNHNGSTSSSTPQLIITSKNNFTKVETSTPHFGYLGCARAIAMSVPSSGLWGVMTTNESQHSVEGWIEASANTLVPIIQGDKKDSVLVSQVTSFVNHIETYLFQANQTYLVGDTGPTAADVVTAIWLSQVIQKLVSVTSSVPQQVYRWMSTIIQSLPKNNTTLLLTIPKEGQASPMEKKKTTAATAAATETMKPTAEAAAPKTAQETKKPSAPAPAPAAVAAPVAPATTSTDDDDHDLSKNPIVQKLVEWDIVHDVYRHALCMTADELVTNVALPSPAETHTKNIFFKDKKHGLFLVTVCPTTDVNTKVLGKALDLQGKVNLRLADETLLQECLGVKPGCVGPLSIVNDKDNKVTLVMEDKLFQSYSQIHSHPLRNDASVKLTPADLQTYLAKTQHEPIVLEFAKPEQFGGKAPSSRPKTETKKPATKQPPQQQPSNKKTTKKGETLLALQWKKDENFPMWYSDVIVLSEMISYYDISGCYILRPWSYKIWELIQVWFNEKIRDLGVENSYFPLFVSQDRLEKEKDHVEGFAPEVAWVTKSGDGVLAKPIAVRPTSETIMYPAFSDWIKSHRDLPLKLNQWSNVVRWEFKDPTPFLRSREFLWQEGHTAHVSHDDADVMVMQALELYRGVYEDLLAVPVIKGYKTEKEKFAGGHQTTTVEAYIPMSGRAIQGATSHNLGQNFGKMFDITYQDEKGNSQIAWQTSWGLTTRTIGVMIMVHGDDTGLVLPPRIAPLQAVIVPILSKKLTQEQATPYCEAILKDLLAVGIRAKYDDRIMYNPGWKYNHWEQKGVPVRIEVGPRDMEQKQARVVLRYNGEKFDLPVDDSFASTIKTKLEDIHNAMFAKAKETRSQHLVQVTEWKDFVPNLELNNLVLTPWCGGEHQDWEEWVKEKSREESLEARGEEGEDDRTATSVAAKTLCIPFDQPDLPEGTKCIASGMPATCWVLWGRSY